MYRKGQSNKEVLYTEEAFEKNEFRQVESRIQAKSGHILESTCRQQLKRERDILGIYKIFEKEVMVKQLTSG